MAADTIRIEYNEELEPLVAMLAGVQRSGDFSVHGRMEIPLPRVEVAGVGVLSFPVPPVQVAALIGQAVRAPYGRGEKTIVDESVRKVWQLPAENVQLSGKSWPANFDAMLQQVIVGLGCEGMPVIAELYKLLVYDPGGFFLTHRDTEKTEGMFGTLVLVLPSAHRGGELVLRHAGRTVTVDLSGTEVSEVSFAAFYADCEHEVRPITEGHRVCLVFNLVQRRGAKGKASSLNAPDYERQIAAAAKLLERCLTSPGAPAKLAWLLEHHYSPDGLCFAGLKSADAARAKVLAQAAERAGCTSHLGIVHIEESGAAQPEYDAYRPRGWGRGSDDDEDEEHEASSSEFEVIEVCDARHYVSQWLNLQDEPVEFGEVPLQPGELLPPGALDDVPPDAQRLMEASGNEGASFERSYHRAALVLWRRERYAEVLLQAGVAAALPYLKESIAASDAAGASLQVRRDVVALARRLVIAWRDAPEFPSFRQPRRPEQRAEMLRHLVALGDVALLEQFISEVVVRDYDGRENAALVASAKLLGPGPSSRWFGAMVRAHTPKLHWHCVALLRALVAGRDATRQPEWKTALREIAAAVVSRLDDVGKEQPGAHWRSPIPGEDDRPVSADLVLKLLDVLGTLGATALRAEAAAQFAARPGVFDPVTMVVPALAKLLEWDAAAQRLWEHSAEFILRRSGQPLLAPTDWRQEIKLVGCACADCRELQAFALDPVERIHRFRVRQDRRQHLHHIIEHHGFDMSHVTERKGSPQTLVCTKDRRHYERRCEEYCKDVAGLTTLAELAARFPDPRRESPQRIAASLALAKDWSPA